VQPLFISVDPENDTPAAVAGFVAGIHPRLIGLTGSSERLAAAAKAYRVEAREIGRTSDGGVIMSHGTYVYLMGPDGKFLTLMPPILDAETMAATIRRYLL
jgi:protein SCO1/2